MFFFSDYKYKSPTRNYQHTHIPDINQPTPDNRLQKNAYNGKNEKKICS